MFLFNCTFISMLENFSNKRSKFELILQYQIYQLIPNIIDKILNDDLGSCDEEYFLD